jgi:ABC-type transport system substrate-binding protein
MMKYILSCILVVLSLQLVACVAQKKTSVAPTSNVNKITNNGTIASSSKNEPTTLKPSNGTKENGTLSGGGGIFQQIKDNKDMLTRTFYVMLGVTSIVVIYFVVRAWRLVQ